MSEIQSIVQDALQKTVAKSPPRKVAWEGSPFEGFNRLEIDQRGAAGEEVVVMLLEAVKREVNYNKNATDEDKHWDFMCDGLKYEVKTAMLGKNGVTFQHENIFRTRQYDGLIFVDIAPSDIYISCWAKRDIPWKELHQRKDGSYYKWDTHLRETRKFPVIQNRVRSLGDFRRLFEEMERAIRARKRPVENL